MMAPISVVLPSLSPLPANNEESMPSVATLIPSTASPAIPVPATLPATCAQPSLVTTVLEAETPMDIDPEAAMTIYSPVYKDKSKLLVELPRSNNIAHSPISSMPSLLFESMDQLEQLEQQHATQINGKRLNHAAARSSPVTQRQPKRTKHDYHQQDLSTTAIQVEATTTSSPYPHFGDVSWSNCHPEPLAVSRWLRISSSRKQYNFNIHWHKTPPTPGWGPCATGVCLPLLFFEILFFVVVLVAVVDGLGLKPVEKGGMSWCAVNFDVMSMRTVEKRKKKRKKKKRKTREQSVVRGIEIDGDVCVLHASFCLPER